MDEPCLTCVVIRGAMTNSSRPHRNWESWASDSEEPECLPWGVWPSGLPSCSLTSLGFRARSSCGARMWGPFTKTSATGSRLRGPFVCCGPSSRLLSAAIYCSPSATYRSFYLIQAQISVNAIVFWLRSQHLVTAWSSPNAAHIWQLRLPPAACFSLLPSQAAFDLSLPPQDFSW